MNPADGTPLAILSFFVAPAVLTNASSVLTLTTSNRFARAMDRARSLLSQIEGREKDPDDGVQLRIRLLHSVEQRARFLVRALNAYYLAVAPFGVGSLASLVGAVLQSAGAPGAETAAFGIAFGGGAVGVGSLIYGSSLLFLEARLTLSIIGTESSFVARTFRTLAAPVTAVSSSWTGSSACRRA
jgi:hypothetical protein